MVIYSIGCSHTYGHCVSHKSMVWSNIIMDSLVKDYTTFGTGLPKLTTESIGRSKNIFVNDAACGVGNDYIFHKTLENVNLLIEEKRKPDYVFIQWSGPNRRQHCTPEGKLMYINLFDNVEQGIKFEPMASEHTLHYIFTLQEFLKSENIKYCFFNYMALDRSIKYLSTFNRIDFNNFINFDFEKKIIYRGLLEFMIENDFSCDEYGHPNERGNYYIASHVAKKLDIDILSINEVLKNI